MIHDKRENARRIFTFILYVLMMFVFTRSSYAQSKFSIGIGPAWNVSKQSNEGAGLGIVIQSEIKISKTASVCPSVGAEIPYLVYAGLAGRYYLAPEIYVLLGALLNVGGDDGAYGGLGETAGAGFAFPLARHHVIDLNFHIDRIQLDKGYFPVGGLRLTYNFSISPVNYKTSLD